MQKSLRRVCLDEGIDLRLARPACNQRVELCRDILGSGNLGSFLRCEFSRIGSRLGKILLRDIVPGLLRCLGGLSGRNTGDIGVRNLIQRGSDVTFGDLIGNLFEPDEEED